MSEIGFNVDSEMIDYSKECKAEIKQACLTWLYEVGGEIKAKISRFGRKDGDKFDNLEKTKILGSFKYVVDENKMEVSVGSPLMNAIWEELGTGSFATNGDGRKGYWVYVKGDDSATSTHSKNYTLQEAKNTVAFMRSKGLNAYYSNGKKPTHQLQQAFDSVKNSAPKNLNERLKRL